MDENQREEIKYKVGITSGYYNPLHIGHLDLLKEARETMDMVFVIVNNDKQQILKKGKVIMPETERMEILKAITYVDIVFLAVDEDPTVCKSIEKVHELIYQELSADEDVDDLEIYFLKGGDRSDRDKVPESEICDKLGIKMLFNVGGNEKIQSSSNINKLNGDE